MKQAVALGCRSAAAAKAVGRAAAVPLVSTHSAGIACASATATPSTFFSRSRSSAILGQPVAYTRRGLGGEGRTSNLHSLGLTWGRATGSIEAAAVTAPLLRFVSPSNGASAAIAADAFPSEDVAISANAATAAATAAASSLLQRRTFHQHQRHSHLSQWSIRYITAQSRPATEKARGSEASDSPRAAAAAPTQAPQSQQHHQHPQQQQHHDHQQHQPRSEGTGDTRGSARNIGTLAGGPGGSPGKNGTKWGLVGALGKFFFAAATKLIKLTWR